MWGIGYDHTAWVYTGGYGGGFIQGMDNLSTAACTFLGSAVAAVLPLAYLTGRVIERPGHVLGRNWHCSCIFSLRVQDRIISNITVATVI